MYRLHSTSIFLVENFGPFFYGPDSTWKKWITVMMCRKNGLRFCEAFATLGIDSTPQKCARGRMRPGMLFFRSCK